MDWNTIERLGKHLGRDSILLMHRLYPEAADAEASLLAEALQKMKNYSNVLVDEFCTAALYGDGEAGYCKAVLELARVGIAHLKGGQHGDAG